MKKQLFIILSCALILPTNYTFASTEKENKELKAELKKQTELAKVLSQKVNALSSKDVSLLIQEAIREKVDQITNSPYTQAIYNSHISHAIQATGWACIVGAALYFYLYKVKANDTLLEHNNGWFILGSFLIGIPNIVKNLHAVLATEELSNT